MPTNRHDIAPPHLAHCAQPQELAGCGAVATAAQGADCEQLLDLLAREHERHGNRPAIRSLAERFVPAVLGLLFPAFAPVGGRSRQRLAADLDAICDLLAKALQEPDRALVSEATPDAVIDSFLAALGSIREALLMDAEAICAGDPAARSVDEVILAYPGFLATATYRIAHQLHDGVSLLPRMLTEVAHRETGIDIHPGARIGESFAIDHGTGIVIGETAILGARVRLYQGVTLGAARVEKRQSNTKRHPTIGDDVVIYANATILGGETVIGRGSRIGGNVWLTRSVPPYSVVTPTARVERLVGSPKPEDDLIEFNI